MPAGRYLARLWEETLLNDMSWCAELDRVQVREMKKQTTVLLIRALTQDSFGTW